jgi:YVTN family beta-propeller protein
VRLLLLLLLLLAPSARADLLYVLNSGEASVSVIDPGTRTEIQRIPMLREPHHLVLTPDGRELAIADSGGNEIMFVTPETGAVLRRERISNPYHLEYSPDGRFFVVASLRRGQVDIYRAEGFQLITRFRPGEMPSHIAFGPDSRMAYVTMQGDGSVIAFDMETQRQVWRAEVGPEPAGIIWHRGRLLVGIMGGEHFVAVDPVTATVTRAFTIGRGAHTIAPAPNGQVLYATSRVDSRLAEIDAETLAVRRVWNLPGGPDCLTFDPEGRVWMTLRWAGRVAMLDPATGAVETIRVGRSPHGIFFKPRRPGIGGDFAQFTPGAISGTRPLATPREGLPVQIAAMAPPAAPVAGRPPPAPPPAPPPPPGAAPPPPAPRPAAPRPAAPQPAAGLQPVALPATPAALRAVP